MTISRRNFIAGPLGAATLVTLGGAIPGFLIRTARAEAQRSANRDTILVVVQLAGGNDGLNTVVPYGNDAYGANRTTLRLPTAKLHKIDSLLGLHPEMDGFNRLYKEGCLAIVQGVGYPNHNQQHDRAMRDWQSAQPGKSAGDSGWIGRAVDRMAPPGDPSTPAVFVGDLKRPFSLNARQAIVPSIQGLDDWTLQQPTSAAADLAQPSDEALGDFVRRTSDATRRTSDKIASIRRAASAKADYPPLQLAARLRTIAELIRADLGIRIFYTELGGQEPGGFDTHAGQRDNHAALLRQLSDSVTAFLDDLRREKLLDRVMLMTFSEFGRTVAENGRRGTDHGSAAPMFLAGGKVRPGLIGAHPSLTDLDNGGLRHHTDFRQVYATVLDRWLGFTSEAILGKQYEPLGIFG